MSEIPKVLICRLIKTTRRLTFDIVYQDPKTIWMGDDDGEYYRFVASNGYEVISRSRMDIQTFGPVDVSMHTDKASIGECRCGHKWRLRNPHLDYVDQD